MSDDESTNVLTGQFFHSWKEHDCGCRLIEWQGEVLGRVTDGVFLIQLFNWVSGAPSDRRLVRVEDMTEWTFYGSADVMNSFYEHGYNGVWSRHEPHERSA